MSKSQTELRTVKKEVDEVNRQLQRATHELEENRKVAETATKDLRGQRELTFSLESQLREKTNRLATFERNADTLQQQLSRKAADLLDSDNNLKAANAEIAKLKDGIVRSIFCDTRINSRLTAKEQDRQADLAKIESLQRALQANEDQLTRTQNDMLDGVSKKRDLDETRAALSAALTKVEAERAKYEKEKAELLDDLRSKEAALAALQNEAAVAASLIAEYNAKLSNLTEMKDAELRSIREELKSLAAQRDGLLVQLQNQEGQLAEVRDSVAKTEQAAAQVDGLKADLEHKAANLEQTETATTQLRAHLTALSEENEKVKLELQTLWGKHDTAVENSKLLAAKVKQMNEEAKQHAQTASQAEGRVRELQATLDELRLQLKKETELHGATKAALQNLEQRLAAASDQLADKSTSERAKQLSAEMESLRTELTDKTKELAAIDASYQQSEKLNAALKKKLLALSEQNQALETRLAQQDQNDQKAMEKLKGALARLLSEQEQSKTLLEAKQTLVSDLRHQVEEDRKLLHQQTADYTAKLSASEQQAAEILRGVREEANHALAKLEKKLSDAVSELERMKSQHNAIDGKNQDQLASLMAQLREAEARNDNLVSAVEAKVKEIEKTRSSLTESEGNVTLLSRALSEAQGNLVGKSRELEQANASLKQHSALNKKLGAKVIQLQEKLKSTEGTAGQLEGKSQDIQTELAAYQMKYAEARERLKLAIATVEKHKLEIKELIGNNGSLKKELEGEVMRSGTLQTQLESLEKELRMTKDHLQTATASVEKMDLRLHELDTDHARLKQDFDELAQENRSSKKRKDDLETELDELRSKLYRLEADSENNVQEAESETAHLREQIRALERRVDDQSDQHTALLHDLSLQQEANNQLKLELADQRSETEAYHVAMNERLAQETDNFTARLEQETEKVATLVAEKALLLRQLADLQEERESLQSQLQDTKNVTQSIRADHNQVDLTNAALQAKLETVQQELNEVEALLRKTQASLDQQTGELQQARRDLQLAEAANAKLREDADALVAEEVKLLKGQHAHDLTQSKDEMARVLQAQKDTSAAQIQLLEKAISDLSLEREAGEDGRRSLRAETERLERELAAAQVAHAQLEVKAGARVQELERLLAGATNNCEELAGKLKSLEAQHQLIITDNEAQAEEQLRVNQTKAEIEAEAAALRLANIAHQQRFESLQQQLALATNNATEAESQMDKADAWHTAALKAKDADLAEVRSEAVLLRKALDEAESKLAEALSQQQLAQISTKHERELATQDSDLVKQQNRELFDRNALLQQKVAALEAEAAERDTEYDMVKLQLQGVKTQLSRKEADAHTQLQESEQKWTIALQRAQEQYSALQLQQSQDIIQHQSELSQLHGRLTTAETALEQQRSQLALVGEEKARLGQQLEAQSAELAVLREACQTLERQMATTGERQSHQAADAERQLAALTDSLDTEKKLRLDLEARLEKAVFQSQQSAAEVAHQTEQVEALQAERTSQDERLASIQSELLTVRQQVMQLEAEAVSTGSDRSEAERLAGKHKTEAAVARDELESLKSETSQKMEQLQQQLTKAQATLHGYEHDIIELEGKLTSANANSQQVEAQKKAMAHRLLELTGQFEAKLAAAHQSIAAAEEAEARAKLEMQTRDSQTAEQVNQIRDLKTKAAALGKNLLKLSTAVEERDQQIEDLTLEVKQLQDERDRATAALTEAQYVEQRLSESRREAAALRLEVQSKATEIELLKAAVENERAPPVEFQEIEEDGEVKVVARRERQLERALADAQTEITVLRVVLEEKNEATKKLQGMVKALSTPTEAQDEEAQSAQRNLANVLKRSKKDQKALRPTGRRSVGGTPHSPVPDRQYAPLHPVAQALEKQWGQVKPSPYFPPLASPTENRPAVPVPTEKLQNQVNALMERNNLLQIRVTALNKMKLELQSQLTEQQAELEREREAARAAVTQVHLWEQKKALRPHVRVDDEIEISPNLTKLSAI